MKYFVAGLIVALTGAVLALGFKVNIWVATAVIVAGGAIQLYQFFSAWREMRDTNRKFQARREEIQRWLR